MKAKKIRQMEHGKLWANYKFPVEEATRTGKSFSQEKLTWSWTFYFIHTFSIISLRLSLDGSGYWHCQRDRAEGIFLRLPFIRMDPVGMYLQGKSALLACISTQPWTFNKVINEIYTRCTMQTYIPTYHIAMVRTTGLARIYFFPFLE